MAGSSTAARCCRLTGAHVFPLPFGRIYSANITPDPETGIGRRTDGELARILRHGVRADGHAAVPLMEYQGMADEDLVAVISFLRSRPAVGTSCPPHDLTLLGKVLMAFAIAPAASGTAGLRRVEPVRCDRRARRVSGDEGLGVRVVPHRSQRSRRAGRARRLPAASAWTSPPMPTKVYVTPNLTPDPATSVIGKWTEDVFIRRFRQGEQVEGSPMPWGAYGRMTDDDLRSVYRYLRSLPPVVHDTGPKVQRKG